MIIELKKKQLEAKKREIDSFLYFTKNVGINQFHEVFFLPLFSIKIVFLLYVIL